ncbi:UBP-type zinc finger domain-containing protein [Micromonospora sonneratiae]|uniref:UBP-type zinc finger domain-containing protein n=1 Tax=Micromonospora sonneratiae TaxID=1184706 RepID=A0ABW3YTH1_9ACTN
MSCVHLTEAPRPTEPRVAQGCQECLAIGSRDWVHLRECLTCGQVGCCDSSPYRHATGHFQSTGHPVMRSAQPGEWWRWCYIDEEIG